MSKAYRDALDRGISPTAQGVKYDSDKLQWHLLDFSMLSDTVKVLMMGAKKYSADGWKKVLEEEQGPRRYRNALTRHWVAYCSGEKLDLESGLNHLSHIIANAIFLLWGDKNGINS